MVKFYLNYNYIYSVKPLSLRSYLVRAGKITFKLSGFFAHFSSLGVVSIMFDEKKSNKQNELEHQPNTRNALIALSLITEIGITMTMNISVGFFVGMYLDRWLNTSFIFLCISSLLGIMSGFRMVYLLIMKIAVGGDKK